MLYRRICLLRVNGRSVEAARLQSTELSQAVGAIRQSAAGAPDCEAKLNALFAVEEERVANASVLAEILLPLLRESAPAHASHAPRAQLSRSASAGRAAPKNSSAAAVPGIADFIDEMIQQERATTGAPAP